VYQQLENHVLQPVIMSRTVQLSALTVLVSILIGVELFGFLGALLAIPVAGVLHVIGRDLYDGYRGRLKPEPTTGTDQIPVSQPRPPLEPGEQTSPTSPLPHLADPNKPGHAADPIPRPPVGSTPHHQKASMQEAPMDHDDRATDTGMLGRRREPRTGPRHQPGRPRPSRYNRRRQCVTTAMSDAGHDRTRLGSHEYVHARQ
jgi:hypothetical protein